ncbi:SDR family oxidoreductase [Saccharopolyspora phatthalungensis]|uniref:NADP-dependent 3-hydroxy acid dehydrogenase YdfG n=1 Tax=Saccharopolyspora phatthalungensis TaxID=664693 RepID=A0A840QJ28_9PSEU|nr:SDR family oxidoreductase [Saccharopolyspora phatthalungensis]MBB5158998.1 NADP-dependent 3-hydroxy acid dehydrogenase YdfG [Saccharopolyspora phatthalungensis]
MAERLNGTTAVVTGASSGIGEATARALAAEGAAVALFARRRDRLDALVKEIDAAPGGTGHVFEVDVTDADAVHTAIDHVAAELGGIDALVNNAGYGMWGPAREADLAEWHKMVDVNLNGVLATTHAALPHLTAAAQGPRGIADIITVSSVGGRKVLPGNNVYAATKHAVGAFSESLRQELAEHHVRVGLVEPGVVVTEMTTNARNNAPDARAASALGVLQASDIADAVVYMLTRPRHAAISEMLIRPTEQTF